MLEKSDISWHRYCAECLKYSMPRLTALENIIRGRTKKLKLRNYCPQSIGLWLVFETLVENPLLIVTHIDCSNSPFTESGCYALNELLESSKTLEHLDLANCGIGYRGIEVLTEGLSYMQCMTYLNLSGCNLRDTGGVIVAQAFRANDTCKTLDLSHNRLFSAAGFALAEMMLFNECLETLLLDWNSLYAENDCVVPLLAGLKKNVSIRRLGLSWNGWTCEPNIVESLRVMLRVNSTLEELDLQNNRLTGFMDEVCEGLRRSKSLRVAKLGGNPLSAADLTLIFSTLKSKVSSLSSLSLGQYKWITKEHALLYQKCRQKNPELRVQFAGVMMSRPPLECDFRQLLMRRIRSLAMKPKKKKQKKDIGQLFLQLRAEQVDKCSMDEWLDKCRAFGAKIDDDLCTQIAAEWQDPNPKSRKVYVQEICDYYLQLFPTENVEQQERRSTRKSLAKRRSTRKMQSQMVSAAQPENIVAEEVKS